MTPDRFDQLRRLANPEQVCHIVHDDTGNHLLERGVGGLSEGRLTAYCVEVFFGLTCDGGFQSLLSGSYQWTVPHLGRSLRNVGLDGYANVIERAIGALFPKGVPSDEEEYERQIDAIYEAFDASGSADGYDDPFEVYEDGFWSRYYADQKEFRVRLHQYIVSNPQAFITTHD